MNVDLVGARAPARTPPLERLRDAADGLARCRSRVGRALLAASLAAPALAIAPGALHAQSAETDVRKMTVEELERHLEAERAALERVRENRDITAEKAREVREALAEREAKRAEVRAELEALCREREEIDPGSYDTCVAQLDD